MELKIYFLKRFDVVGGQTLSCFCILGVDIRPHKTTCMQEIDLLYTNVCHFLFLKTNKII